MSFKFNWNFFNQDELMGRARTVLREAMNKGPQPEVIVEDIDIERLDLGTMAPNLEILEIGDLDSDKFRGIFKLEYNGDASLTLRTTVEANPLAQRYQKQNHNLSFTSPGFEQAAQSLRLPLSIDISQIKLSAIIILVFSKAHGLTLVFRNDPLQSVKVTSTFDFLPGVSKFLKQEIEERLRESFCEDLPEVLYQLSQQVKDQDQSLGSVHSHGPVTWPQHTVDYNDILASHSHRELDLTSLSQCQNTLALFTPSLKDAITRPTVEPQEEPVKVLETPSKIPLHDLKKALRVPYQSKPKRRVIKLNQKPHSPAQLTPLSTSTPLSTPKSSASPSPSPASKYMNSPHFYPVLPAYTK